jgi:hypothetical protein
MSAIEVIVCRDPQGPGCAFDDPDLKWGEDIIDPLITSTEAAQERGRVEIDRVYTNRTSSVISRGTLEYIKPGDLYSVLDPENSDPDIGMIRSVSLNLTRNGDSFTSQANVTMEFNR